MRTHRFDAVSFVFGALFAAVAVVGLIDVALLNLADLRWLAPAVLVLLGAVLVVSAARPDRDQTSDRRIDDTGPGRRDADHRESVTSRSARTGSTRHTDD